MKKILILALGILLLSSQVYSKANKNARIKIIFKNTVITATLYPNATTKAFLKKLPLTLKMKDLYGRELVYRFKNPLPAHEASYRSYKISEIIYYPPLHSFVLMYAQTKKDLPCKQ